MASSSVALRIVGLLAIVVALVMSFVPHFVSVGVEAAPDGDAGFSSSLSIVTTTSGWVRWGVLGGLGILVALTFLSLACGLQAAGESAHWVADALAVLAIMGSALMFILLIVTTGSDFSGLPVPDLDVSARPGWSGWATFTLLGTGAAVSLVGAAGPRRARLTTP